MGWNAGYGVARPVPDQNRLTLEHVDAHGPLHIGCEGHVVRVEVGPEAMGVAVSISAYDFGANEVP